MRRRCPRSRRPPARRPWPRWPPSGQGPGPETGYSRDHFGAGWADMDRNGCDTRNDVLARDLTA